MLTDTGSVEITTTPGLPDAIAAIWPLATTQTCVVHLVRNCLRYASKADWSKITTGLKIACTAPTIKAAEQRFGESARIPGWKNILNTLAITYGDRLNIN